MLLPTCQLSEGDVLLLVFDPNLNRLISPSRIRPHLQGMHEMNLCIIHTIVSCFQSLLDEDML